MPKRVHLPDGRIVNFPDSMTPQDIQAAMVTLSGGSPASASPTGESKPPQTFQEQSAAGMERIGDVVRSGADVLTGMGQSVGKTVLGVADLARKGMQTVGVNPDTTGLFDAGAAIARGREMVAPKNTAQQVGQVAGDVAQMMIPAAKVASLTKAAPLAGQMGAQAATGAAVTGAQTGGDLEDMAISALLMGAAPAVAKAASAIGKGLTERLPERLYTQIFKSAYDDVAQALRTEAKGTAVNPTLAKEAVERGLMGSTRNMAVYSVKKLDALEAQLQKEAARRILVLPKKGGFIDLLDDVEQQFSKGFFGERAAEAAALKAALKNVPGPGARATDMLKVKRFLDGLRTSTSFRLDPKLAPKQEELKIAADLVRSKLHSVPTMSKLIQEERVFIQAFEALVDDAVRTGNRKLLSLTDVMLGGGGLASGFPGAGMGAMAAVRLGQTPRVLTGIGQALYKAGRAVPTGTAGTGARAAAAMGAEAAR